MATNAPVESNDCSGHFSSKRLSIAFEDISNMRRAGTFHRWTWGQGLCCLGIVIVLGGRLFAEDLPSSVNTSVDSPSAAVNEANPADVNLDALLDLADKAPETLQSINVKEAPRGLAISPDLVFNPNENHNTANSIGELLTNAPGVISRSTSALNQDARIRGYSGSQAVAVANGMNQGRTRLDIDSLFSQIDPNLVESITVIAGPYSVEYGPGFAFFDAQLISPGRSNVMKYTSVSNFGFNTNGQQLMWRETAGFSDQHSGAIVSFGQRMGNDYRAGSPSTDFHVPASYHVQDVYAVISGDITERSRVDASFLHQAIQDTELPGVAYDINRQNADQINLRFAWRDDSTNTDRFQAQFWWNEATYSADASRPSKQITFVSRLIDEPYPDMAGGGTLIGNGLSDNWGARGLALFGDQEVWQLRTGVDWRRIRQFYREQDFQANGAPALMGDTFGIPNSSQDDFGVFAGGTWKPVDRWTLAAGQRLDAVAYGLTTSDLVVTSTQNTPNLDFYPGFDTSTRLLSTTYFTSSIQATDDLTLNAGVAYAMRPPNLTELYSDQPFAPMVRFGNSFAFGDSALASEKNLQFDLGFTKRYEKAKFGARAFHSEIHDYIGLAASDYGTFPLIGTVPPGTLGRGRPYMADPNIPNQDLNADSASFCYIYRNIDRVTLSGFDVIGEQQARPWLEFAESINYTYANNCDPTWVDVYTGQVNQLGSSEGLPGIYPISGAVSIRLVEPENRKWTLEWQSRAAARQNHLAYSLGEVGTPSFIVHNIYANYRFTDHISLRTSLLNVFDLNYYEHNSLAIVNQTGNISFVKNPGLSWFAGLDCSF